ncbi:MAG: hypothetical protein A2252_05890 [Elusimicrobia bacterium RIFOXYA2_FULL_39_19]|nr:MAG: hypothetical protein A2252_05890 [Elusimicrobia bacterium RIFOXYA2_FULL_39_19]
MNQVSNIVIGKLLAEMEKGVIPWKQPWISVPKQNFVSKRPYAGINRLLLAFESEELYLSFKQIRDLKGRLKAGSKAQMVIFWKPIEVKAGKGTQENTDEKPECRFVLRYYNVFRLADCEGIERPVIGKPNEKLEDIEAFIMRISPKIEFGGSTACYNPKSDTISMPAIERFNDSAHYYATLCHELIHWTGDKNRLNRFNQDTQNYHQEYSKEELVAEIGSAILCHSFGISLPEHNAGYVNNWMRAIKADSRILFGACSKAEKAVEWLSGLNAGG